MKARTPHLLAAATLTGILLTGTACGAPQAARPATTETAATATATASATAEPTATTAITAAPAVTETPAAAPAPVAPQPAALKTFTFPDGHLSFTRPAGWTVKTNPGPALNPEQQKHSFDAVITDHTGEEVAHIMSGMYDDGASAPAKRVLDHAPVPAIHDERGGPTELGFAYDEYPASTGGAAPQNPGKGVYYFMDVRRSAEFLTDLGSSGTNQVHLPTGVMTARVFLGEPGVLTPAFGSPHAAKAWMGTEQYAQLKAMLLSLNYN